MLFRSEIAKQLSKWRFELIGQIADYEKSKVDQWLITNNRILEDGRAQVIFHGRLNPTSSWELSKGAWAGLSLLEPTPAFVEAVPSKLYEYAFMGIPVIATNLPRVAELIVEGGFGFVVNTSEVVTQSVTAFKE